MKTQNIGRSSLVSTRLAYGCMRVLGTWKPAEVTPERMAGGVKAILAAHEAGYVLFDTADIYCRGKSEEALGAALRESAQLRKTALIATKCGIRFAGEPHPDSPHRYDFSAEHIVWSCEQSLKRLGVETIDLYQLHRPDFLADPAEIAGAFDQLRRQGKVRHFGVSNFRPSLLSAIQSACDVSLIVNQVEIHLGRLDCLTDGTLDQCLEHKITPLSWSPLGKGLFADGGKVDPAHGRRAIVEVLLEVLDNTAARYDTSRTAVSLAWLLKHPAGIIPIVGSANPAHILEATKADQIDMTREDWYRILIAARGEPLP